MKRSLYTAFVFIILCGSISAQNNDVQLYHPHRVIVQVKEGSDLLETLRQSVPQTYGKVLVRKDVPETNTSLNAFFDAVGVESIRAVKPGNLSSKTTTPIERIFIVTLSASTTVEDAVSKLKELQEIEVAEPDYVGTGGGQKESMMTPNDPSFNVQWGLKNTGQNFNGSVGKVGIDINISQAWDITTGSSGQLLAVMDTGIPTSSPEFSGRVVPGYDFVNNDSNPTDDHGHGSNVTSVAAATGNNGTFMAGANWKCKIMHLKTLDKNNAGFYSYWISALTMAADSGAKVINISAGGSSQSSTLKAAVDYAAGKGAIIVACTMNFNNEEPYYPAAYPNVIAVGAINNKGSRAAPFCWGGGSNFGTHIDFCAPGDFILGIDYTDPTKASYWCGTSQATPMVAGIVSLMTSLKSDLTFQQVYDALKSTAKDAINTSGEDTQGWDKYFGWGLVDAHAAVKKIKDQYVTTITTAGSNVPSSYALQQNYPNPFNPETSISFSIPEQQRVTVKIFDALGKEISTIVENTLPAGDYTVPFHTELLSSGTYFYSMEAGQFFATKKMILLK